MFEYALSNVRMQSQSMPMYENLPLLQLVRIESSVNSNQQSGSGSTTLDMTGGNIAVVALGSTGCSIICSSSLSAEGLEFDRSLLEVVICVSVRCSGFAKRDDTLPRCRTEDCNHQYLRTEKPSP